MKNKFQNLGFSLKRTDLKNIIGANSGNMPSKCAGLFTQAQWEGCNCNALQLYSIKTMHFDVWN